MRHGHPFRHHANRHLAHVSAAATPLATSSSGTRSTTIAISASRLAASAHRPGTSSLVAIQTPAASSQSASTR